MVFDISNKKNKSYRPSPEKKPNHQSVRDESKKYQIRDYASKATDIAGGLSSSKSSVNITKAQLQNYLRNPLNNAQNISSAMINAYVTNGTMANIIDYFTNLLTYNYNIYPVLDVAKGESLDGDVTQYLSIANYIDKYQLKFYAPYFVKKALLQGAAYFYEIEAKNGIVYMELPPSMCRVSSHENGVYRIMIDVTLLERAVTDTETLPKELSNAITADKNDEKKFVDGKWYIVGKKGFAITFDNSVIENGGVAIPKFASTLLEIADIDTAKQNVPLKDDIDTVRLIHGEIPKDREGNIQIAPDEAELWARTLSRGLPNGVAATVTPFELENIPLNGSGSSKAYETVKDAQEQIYKSTGVAGSLLGESTTSSNIIKLSIQKDAIWAYNSIIPVLTSYYNSVLSNAKTEFKHISWKIKIIEQNIFNFDDAIKMYKDSVTNIGGSRTDLLASIGMIPSEIYGKLYMEQKMLDIDDLLVIKPTAFTASGGVAGGTQQSNGPKGEVGRPETNNPTDDTERINDSN